jgi:hypothetical protein
MEFVLYTRTYSIQKARGRLGFEPWVGQSWAGQEEAVKGSVALYLNDIGGSLLPPKPVDWPEEPFRLDHQNRREDQTRPDADPLLRQERAPHGPNAQHHLPRAQRHLRAPHAPRGSQDAADLLHSTTLISPSA